MKVVVLGAGVVGISSAWYLAAAGHDVTVIEREEGAGLQTSFANGGQISVSHAEPWANPHAPLQALRWLGREDAPLLFRLRADPAQWWWALRFLRECTPGRTRRNIGNIVRLALYSRHCLQALRAATGIAYDHLERGILHLHTDQAAYAAAVDAAAVMREFGLDRHPINVDQCLAIEPELAGAAHLLVGGDWTPSDESGDAHKFTRNLATLCAERGVHFRYGTRIEQLLAEGGRITGVTISSAAGQEVLSADAYVVALGSYSPLLLRPLGMHLPIYPAKGYSATIELADPAENNGAPTVSLTDDSHKLVFSRLGNRLRVAGTAEFNGYNLDLNPVRCAALLQRTRQLFPALKMVGEPQYWCGLRPATPSNLPYIGRSPYNNLWINSGHGTLGWTMACGSGAALAELISGRQPEPEFSFLG